MARQHTGRIIERNISAIKDVNGNQIVIVNDIHFKGKRNIDWDEVEQYLKRSIGKGKSKCCTRNTGDDRDCGEQMVSGKSGKKT